jgi:glyoxylase-like metal-dependent hydrolase (beta-lactamase superfamily II)
VIEFHPGHSPTDLVIRVPERDVVFAGDLFFSRAYPVVADSDILAWRRVVDTLAGYGRQTQVVPGHGALGSIEQVRQQAAVMDDLRAHADSMMRAGASIDEAERRYVVPKAFSGFEILSWNFTVGGAMRTYYSARQ